MESDLRKNIVLLKKSAGLTEIVECSTEENKAYTQMMRDKQPLPNNVFCKDSDGLYFYMLRPVELTEQEIDEYIKLKKLHHIKIIKNCVVFFTVLTIISMLITLISMINLASAFM